jgi:hypothetical protein
MNTKLVKQIEAEIEQRELELAALRAALKVFTAPAVPSPSTNGEKPTEDRQRAPKGALEEAMVKAIAAKPGLSNGELRTRLKKDGYAWSLTPLHVGKRLSALVSEKRLTVQLDGNARRYFPVK